MNFKTLDQIKDEVSQLLIETIFLDKNYYFDNWDDLKNKRPMLALKQMQIVAETYALQYKEEAEILRKELEQCRSNAVSRYMRDEH